jgi:FtsP/CotA-like multicopper oxidase with cupredoxin domain
MKIFARKTKKLSRRDFLKTALGSGLAITGLAGISANKNVSALPQVAGDLSIASHGDSDNDHGNPGTVGQVDHEANGFDPLSLQRNHLFPEENNYNEMVMVMNGFDTNFDGDNEVYAANSIAFAYMNDPIKIKRDQPQRIYLVNITEFDPINSMHLHANFFDYYDHGTTLQPTLRTVDTIMQCQAQRGILEFSFKGFESGLYMFHAHQSEFAELGWMGFFEVVE